MSNKKLVFSGVQPTGNLHLGNYLDYNYNYKAVYLISIVSFVGMFYLLSCYLLGILKLKNYKTN